MTRACKPKIKVEGSNEGPAPAGPSVQPTRKYIKFNAHARDEFLRHLQEGKTKSAASDLVGISRVTIYQYRQDHPEYEEQVHAAEIRVVEAVEDALYAQALKGNVKAQEIVLYNRAPERWADRGKREVKEEPPQGPADPLPSVLQVLDDHPEAKKDLIKRMELMSE